MTEGSPTRYLSKWLDIGKQNPWIREACDPPFNTRSFHECKDDAELLAKFKHGNWCLGQAFHIGDLCFIQQVDGGDEYLAIKGGHVVDSIGFGRIIERSGEQAVQEVLGRLRAARVERCQSLDS